MTSINSASLSAGLTASLEVHPNHTLSEKLSLLSEEGPGCGTPPPGFHPPRPHGLELSSYSSALDKVALNPQPLPPREEIAASLSSVSGLLSHSSRFDAVAINPQPLPPRELSSYSSALDRVALNPQPLPPREAVAGYQSAGQIAADEQCGTVPRWIHHLPPPPPQVDPNNNPASSHGIIIIGG